MPSATRALAAGLQKYLMILRLISLSRSAPKDASVAWERYWSGIGRTGTHSDVLWDSGNDHEFTCYQEILERHLQRDLPVLDIGCGHGSFTRALASVFPQAIGVDLSTHAVERARAESAGTDNASYLARDMTAPGAGAGLAGPAGVNVFVRGVLHVLDKTGQAALARNLQELAGTRGTVFVAETNFHGNPAEYVSHLGATPRAIPDPLERAIRDLPMPGHFGPAERARAFPAEAWDLLEDGPVNIEINPLTGAGGGTLVPGYYAVLRPRPRF